MQLDGLRVLIVEDDALLALDLKTMLEAQGCAIVGVCSRVADAVHFIEAAQAKLDVALVDLQLGDLSAVPVIEALQQRRVPCAILSGRSEQELAALALPHYSKPIVAEEIMCFLLQVKQGPKLG